MTNNNNKNICPICLEDIIPYFPLEPCGHKIHKNCCYGLVSNKCPLCRTEITNFPKKIEECINKTSEIYHQEIQNEQANYFNLDGLDLLRLLIPIIDSTTPQISDENNDSLFFSTILDNFQQSTQINNSHGIISFFPIYADDDSDDNT